MNLSENIIKRYSDRLKKFGNDFKTLGWGSKEQQLFRFQEFSKHILDIQNKSIIDIGCGLGDFYDSLGKACCSKYMGVDINPDLINEAKKKHKGDARVDFMVKDLLKEKSDFPVANVGVMIGVLNLNLKGQMNNIDFTQIMIKNAFSYVDTMLLIDFISHYRIEEYPEEDFIFYHKPQEVLEFCFELTNNISLFHNYQPIPQKEFIICLKK